METGVKPIDGSLRKVFAIVLCGSRATRNAPGPSKIARPAKLFTRAAVRGTPGLTRAALRFSPVVRPSRIHRGSSHGSIASLAEDLERMSAYRTLRALGLCASLGLGGCQTRSDEGIAVVPGVEPTLPASNEAYQVGRVNLAAGNNGLAERNFRQAVEVNKDDAAAWIGLAAAYDNLGRYELADRAYDQATSLRGETLEIVNNRGYSYMLRGNGKRALGQFEQALAMDPNNPVIQNNIQILRLGRRPTRSTPF